jgi:serine/threonine-protein kinase
MEIRVDGKGIGNGEAAATLPEGKHRIDASDKALHVYASRDVDLKHDHQKERIVVGSSQLAFDVPSGATVTVDGKLIGTAPVAPVTLYAGTHEVDIEYNGASTVQKVPMHADIPLTLTVHAN